MKGFSVNLSETDPYILIRKIFDKQIRPTITAIFKVF